MSTYFKLCEMLESLVTRIGILLFAAMITVVFYEVVMRYVFGSPTFWSEAAARAAMIWLVMLGLAGIVVTAGRFARLRVVQVRGID